MTEKRYINYGYEEKAIEEQSFTDTETQKTYYVDYFDEIIDLVNNQDERIKILEVDNADYKSEIEYYKEQKAELEKEIESKQRVIDAIKEKDKDILIKILEYNIGKN